MLGALVERKLEMF